MKKVLFLMFLLLLMGLGAANVKAQVRIGGNSAPNAAAALDLNATDATNNGTKGLALPRVNLTSNTMQLTTGVTNLTGMLVYNTTATLGVGIYFWNGSNWIIISGDGIIGNELTDTIAGGGLTKSGSGTAISPWRVGIKTSSADSGKFLMSTGNSVTFRHIFGPGTLINTALPLKSPPAPITWTSILYAVVSVQSTDALPIYLTAPGLTWFDHCACNAAGTWVVTYTDNVIIYSSSPRINTTAISIECWRPSI